jgi:hypothetical protein
MTEVLAPLRAGDHVLADFLEASGNLDAAMIVRGHEPEGRVYLWLLSQVVSTGYDTYDSCVVAAKDEHSAKRIHPSPFRDDRFSEALGTWVDRRGEPENDGTWAHRPDQVKAVRIGVTLDQPHGAVVCSSFNAG